MNVIGIDPGYGGAIAVEGRESWHIYDMPTITIGKKRVKPKSLPEGKKRRRPAVKTILDLVEIRKLLLTHDANDSFTYIFIEKSQAMPKQGVTGVGHYMLGYGQLIGLFVGLNIPYTEVTPQAWKKVMMAGMGKEKDDARIRAMQIYPKGEFGKKKDHGRAEALLIGEYGRRELRIQF